MEEPLNVTAWLGVVAASSDPPGSEDRKQVVEMLRSAAMCRVVGEALRRQRERALGLLMSVDPEKPLAVQEAKNQLRVVQQAFEVIVEVVNE